MENFLIAVLPGLFVGGFFAFLFWVTFLRNTPTMKHAKELKLLNKIIDKMPECVENKDILGLHTIIKKLKTLSLEGRYINDDIHLCINIATYSVRAYKKRK